MSKPAITSLAPIVYGDTWDGLPNCSFSSDGSAFASDLALVRMFFKNADSVTGLELSSATSGQITITDTSAWVFDVEPIEEFPLAVGEWYWSIETTDANDVRKTYVSGSIEVLDDATK